MVVPSQTPPLSDALRRFLAAPRFATISTLMPDGSPHQAVVWYAIEGDVVMINSLRGRRWPTNLERDPRISLAVYDNADTEHWVGLRGTAEVVRQGPTAVADIQDLARRYDGDPGKFEGQDRITFRIHVHSSFDNGD